MKLNNKGFALTSVIYMLIVLFLMTMLLILANLAQRKVVLDKIKSDVKQELNQGGVLAQNIYTVTFDPTIGQINQTTKQVTYNEPYGELPTPTREGYRFIGWRGKNLAPEINENNYDIINYENRTTSEFKSENGENYIRINGQNLTDHKDTLWRISNINKIKLYQGEYTLSFDVRSENSTERQYIMKRNSNTDGKTGIYINSAIDMNNMISNIENDYNFDNDGQWHHFTSKVIIPYDTNDALIVIGNDRPNLYRENSYIDIKNIQLEQADTATSYEPYFGNVTSDTIVTRQENHTLYAMWEPLYTVTFDSNGGTLTENTKYVAYNEPYGQLPTPTKEGYRFVGWAKQTYDTYNFIRYYDESNVLRISPDTHYQSPENQIIEDRDILIFDVSFSDSTIHSIEIDDKVLDSSKYSSENGRVYGKINIEEAMLKKGEIYFYNFIDINYNAEPTNYTVNKFILIKHDDIYTPQTIVTKQENHTLYAIWEANS